jgi:uncharacterized protein DUF2867
MKVDEVKPDIDCGALLPGAQFADAWRIAIDHAALDARRAAERTIGRQPRWARALVILRNILVTPFGLKTSGAGEAEPGATRDMIGIFPVVSETPQRLVAGFNDRHLDFRVVVDVASTGSLQTITVTTLVLTHNELGRSYLAIILPFHRLIVRAMLRQIAA